MPTELLDNVLQRPDAYLFIDRAAGLVSGSRLKCCQNQQKRTTGQPPLRALNSMIIKSTALANSGLLTLKSSVVIEVFRIPVKAIVEDDENARVLEQFWK